MPDDAGPPPAHLRRFVESLPTAGRALDLGCGDGRLTIALPAERVTAVDVSSVALERAARRLPGAELALVGPDEPLPFEDARFELVLCAETVEHVRDVQLLLSEARRVLRPGGLLGVTTPAHGRWTGLKVLAGGFERPFDPFSPHIRFFTARSLGGALHDLGFALQRLRREAGTLLAVASRA